MKSFKYILASISLGAYVFLALFGVLMLLNMHHHSMPLMNEDCPFMIGESSFCSMNLMTHIELWKGFTQITLVKLSIIYFFVLTSVFIFLKLLLRPPIFEKNYIYLKPVHEDFRTILFSRGILNSKAF